MGRGPEAYASAGEPSRTPPPRGRQSPFSSATPLSAEPLLQALATANSTVLDGLSAQMQALQAERVKIDAAWARVEEGRRSVEAMVEAGRKAHGLHVAELEARRGVLAEVAREVKEERETALIAIAVMDEVRADFRLQYGTRMAELEEKLDAARRVLAAVAARERRTAEIEASTHQREEALEARTMALEERTGTLGERALRLLAEEAAVRRRAGALDRRARELEALEERARALDAREATLAVHEAVAAE